MAKLILFYSATKTGTPFYRQIIDQIKFGIAAGNLKTGEQLPTVRALAVELKVNLNTVAKAYRELEIQQVLETQQGTGTFIGDIRTQLSDKEKNDKLREICNEFSIDDMIDQLEKQKSTA